MRNVVAHLSRSLTCLTIRFVFFFLYFWGVVAGGGAPRLIKEEVLHPTPPSIAPTAELVQTRLAEAETRMALAARDPAVQHAPQGALCARTNNISVGAVGPFNTK